VGVLLLIGAVWALAVVGVLFLCVAATRAERLHVRVLPPTNRFERASRLR
jgi:predicted membrane channel-forming protein YqfA (hemolysin III family)